MGSYPSLNFKTNCLNYKNRILVVRCENKRVLIFLVYFHCRGEQRNSLPQKNSALLRRKCRPVRKWYEEYQISIKLVHVIWFRFCFMCKNSNLAWMEKLAIQIKLKSCEYWILYFSDVNTSKPCTMSVMHAWNF